VDSARLQKSTACHQVEFIERGSLDRGGGIKQRKLRDNFHKITLSTERQIDR
jgi:hypothetical protein